MMNVSSDSTNTHFRYCPAFSNRETPLEDRISPTNGQPLDVSPQAVSTLFWVANWLVPGVKDTRL